MRRSTNDGRSMLVEKSGLVNWWIGGLVSGSWFAITTYAAELIASPPEAVDIARFRVSHAGNFRRFWANWQKFLAGVLACQRF